MGDAQLTLALYVDQCAYGDCTRKATHDAVCDWVRGLGANEQRGQTRVSCCLRHANYYAEAWAAGPVHCYPGLRDAAWIEPHYLRNNHTTHEEGSNRG